MVFDKPRLPGVHAPGGLSKGFFERREEERPMRVQWN
jgi:hypothetical protein